MTTILQINSSLTGDAALSTRLADDFVARWLAKAPGTDVIRRDLARDPVPHLDWSGFQAALTPATGRSADQSSAAALADTLIEELQAADILVMGIPMYNFNIPSTLKAWIDHVARAGTTFRYTQEGPEGLLKDKRAFLFMTRGGKYAGTDNDFQTPYLRQVLGFLGITRVEFIYAEGTAMGEEAGRSALASARHCIEALAA